MATLERYPLMVDDSDNVCHDDLTVRCVDCGKPLTPDELDNEFGGGFCAACLDGETPADDMGRLMDEALGEYDADADLHPLWEIAS